MFDVVSPDPKINNFIVFYVLSLAGLVECSFESLRIVFWSGDGAAHGKGVSKSDDAECIWWFFVRVIKAFV